MRNYVFFLLLVSIKVLASSNAELPLLFGKDERLRVQPTQMPWLAVGQLRTQADLLCTGTLVAPDVVLTAAHCFLDKKGHFSAARYFMMGLWGNKYIASSPVEKVYLPKHFLNGLHRHPDGIYIPSNLAAHDYAFMRLKKPLGKEYGYIPVFSQNRQALKLALTKQAWRVTQGGYPIDSKTHLMVHEGCLVTRLLSDGRIAHRCDTLEGDSGSPIMLRDGKTTQIIAVQSSAPVLADRQRDDNIAVSTTEFYLELQHFIHQTSATKP